MGPLKATYAVGQPTNMFNPARGTAGAAPKRRKTIVLERVAARIGIPARRGVGQMGTNRTIRLGQRSSCAETPRNHRWRGAKGRIGAMARPNGPDSPRDRSFSFESSRLFA